MKSWEEQETDIREYARAIAALYGFLLTFGLSPEQAIYLTNTWITANAMTASQGPDNGHNRTKSV